ncbi:MAG TPA: hypothetical protein VK590_12350, partial [Saprospiraceae bacterium]|nr:hypothetical protein [Saprospiraceae bacterium]
MNYIRLILGLFIFFCTSITSFAQWNKINQPYGYNIHSSYIDKKGNLFIENEDSIYYSTDSGDSWSNIGGYFTDDLRFLIETDNGDIYRKSVGTLFKFNKLTKTFEFFYQSTALINIDNQGWIWLYAYNGFYISKDNGQNFENINLGYDWSDCQYFSVGSYKNEYKLFMERCSSNSGLLYKIDSNGFTLVSNVPIGIGYFYINPNTGTIFVSNADSMYRSANTGESFAPMIPRSKKYELSYFATLDNGDLIIKDYDLRYSKNDGLTWNNISENYISGPPAFNDINSSGFVNASDTIVSLIGTCKTQGVYKSTDKGANWGVINDNLSIPVVDRYVEDAIGNLYAFTCSDTSILKTSDKGKSWSKFIINYKGNAYSVSDIAVNSRGEIFATTPGFVFKSVDNGSSFIELNVPQAKLYPTAFNIYARNNFVYLLNPYFSLFSKNNGNTWWQTNLIFPGSSKYQININGDLYFSQSGFELYRYSAAKDYVEFVSMNILNFDIVANGYIYFMNWGKAYVSKDNMKTNTQINIPYDVGMYNPIYLYSDDNNDIYFQYANY